MTSPEAGPIDETAGAHAPAAPSRSGLAVWYVLIGLAVLILPVTILVVLTRDDSPQELVIEVPAGTGARLDAGEQIQLMDTELTVSVGDHLIVRNLDDRVHTVGPFTVRAGETLDQEFRQPGVIEGVCTINPDETVRITIIE